MNAHAERVCVLRYDSIKGRSIFASQVTDTPVRAERCLPDSVVVLTERMCSVGLLTRV